MADDEEPEDPGAVVDALVRDRSSGASEIAARAAEVLPRLVAEADADDERAALVGAGRRLVEAHPAMAPLVNLVNDALLAWDDDGPAVLDRLRAEMAARGEALADQAAGLVDDGAAVVTYSRSGSVLAGLRRAAEEGRSFRVQVSEARPGGEGVTVAGDLAQAGVEVTLTTDAALFGRLDDADLLLVGADALCAAGFVNKVGTAALCLAARQADLGALVVAGTDKLLPRDYAEAPPLDVQGSLDVDVPKGVRVDAPLFELCPLDRVNAVVTEDGPVPPAMVPDRVDGMPVAEELRDVVEDPDGDGGTAGGAGGGGPGGWQRPGPGLSDEVI